MADYEALKNKQTELIRKALDGSVFVADITAAPIAALTQATGVDPNTVIDLAPLPPEYDDLGWLTNDGSQFSRDVTSSDTT